MELQNILEGTKSTNPSYSQKQAIWKGVFSSLDLKQGSFPLKHKIFQYANIYMNEDKNVMLCMAGRFCVSFVFVSICI